MLHRQQRMNLILPDQAGSAPKDWQNILS